MGLQEHVDGHRYKSGSVMKHGKFSLSRNKNSNSWDISHDERFLDCEIFGLSSVELCRSAASKVKIVTMISNLQN